MIKIMKNKEKFFQFRQVFTVLGIAALPLFLVGTPALADKLDDIVSSGALRCGVMLDFPPLGYRDASGNPAENGGEKLGHGSGGMELLRAA